MAYQSVGTPRFYINVIEWLYYSGYMGWPSDNSGYISKNFKTIPISSQSFFKDTRHRFKHANEDGGYIYEGLPSTHDSDKGFIAILGHTLGDNHSSGEGETLGLLDLPHTSSMKSIVNGGDALGGSGGTQYDIRDIKNGFSIMEFNIDDTGLQDLRLESFPFIPNIGSLLLGTYYDMPYSANLNLTMNMEYDSVKEITSHSGASFSNAMWSRQPLWNNAGAWELYDPILRAGLYPTSGYCDVSGQIINFDNETQCNEWSGTWHPPEGARPSCINTDGTITTYYDAYCLNSNGWPDYSVQSEDECDSLQGPYFWVTEDPGELEDLQANCSAAGGTFDPGGYDEIVKGHQIARSGRKSWQLTFSSMDDDGFWGGIQAINQSAYGDSFSDNLLTDDSFFAQVWHRTLNGSLPFMFQPNSLDNTHFVIAQFRSNTLKVTQSAFNVYDISVIIEEVW